MSIFSTVKNKAPFALAVLLAASGVAGFTAGHTDRPARSHAVKPVAAHAKGDGEQVYLSRCMSCHQMNGQGVPGVFPPLVESEWVSGDKGHIIRIVLHGLSGEIEVKGTVYSGAMPPWGTFLTDQEIADVITYVRSNWGNEADAVTPEEVATLRSAAADRKQPWTSEELLKEENSGIPGADSTSGR